ncbi:hypothetical protein C0V80_05025 [Leuconostoc pseudomesenteroides]|nr:hypothetical protein [Leuconostoc pseudomesenteroides]
MNPRFDSSGRRSNSPELMSAILVDLYASIISDCILGFVKKGVDMAKGKFIVSVIALLIVAVPVNQSFNGRLSV